MRRTYDIRPQADGIVTCNRCGRKIHTGERVTVTWGVAPDYDAVVYRHAGRACPRTTGGAALASRLMDEVRRAR